MNCSAETVPAPVEVKRCCRRSVALSHPYIEPNWYSSPLGLCKSSFSLLEYSVELGIEYFSTQLIPNAAINYTVVQNKQISGSSFKFEVSNGLKRIEIMSEMLQNSYQAKF